jgi:hypothetical protein
MIDPQYDTAAQAIGPDWRLAIPLAVIFGVFALGYAVFRRAAPRLAEDL